MSAGFPVARPRRLRRTAALRRLVAPGSVRAADLVLPLFVKEGIAEPRPVDSMPGVLQHTRDSLRKAAVEAVDAGVGGLILFGIPAAKDARGSAADDPAGIIQLALGDLAAEVGQDTVLLADLCLCEYTDHGHCGVLTPSREVDNDATLERYASAAVAQAAAGADAVWEILLDVGEGADIVMVKPALPYLDVIAQAAAVAPVPVAAYQVSGEYAMVEAAAANGWLDRDRVIMETLTAIRRAGASIILTYWATEAARRLG